MVERDEQRHPAALRVADQRDRYSERCQPASDRPDRVPSINRTNMGVSMSGQIGGMDLESAATERRELNPGQREAVERGNNPSGSIDPDGEIARGLISPDPRPGLRPSSPCRS